MRKINAADGSVVVLKNGVIRYKDRDIVMVLCEQKRQPFYRSTGRNSGSPDTWFPFDGIKYPNTCCEWFDKEAYRVGRGNPLHRYGSEQYKQISEMLGHLNIPHGTDVETATAVNLFLGVVKNYESSSNR